MMHSGLVDVLVSIPKDVGILEMAIVTEARGLRAADASRPGDVVVLDLFAKDSHLVVDSVVTTVYRNAIFQGTSTIPGYAAKQAKDRKFQITKEA